MEGKERVYHGETARNLHVRSQEHYNALRNKCKKSFIHKHILKEHDGNSHNVEFEWGITGKFVKPLYRQINEAISIEKMSIEECLNSKQEYFHQDVKRVSLNNVNTRYQCNFCGMKCQSLVDLKQHEKLVHVRYQCGDQNCDYISFGEKDLKYHKTQVHNSNNQ